MYKGFCKKDPGHRPTEIRIHTRDELKSYNNSSSFNEHNNKHNRYTTKDAEMSSDLSEGGCAMENRTPLQAESTTYEVQSTWYDTLFIKTESQITVQETSQNFFSSFTRLA